MSRNGAEAAQAHCLTMVGISHQHAPLAVRERFALSGEGLAAAREEIAQRFGAGAIVATCNRLELYVSSDPGTGPLRRFVCEVSGADPVLAERYLRPRRDAEAARHLYAVAAGIDSMVLGESEILGQVRSAFSATVAAGADDAVISRLFHTAIGVGRRARTQTAIGRHALSISSIAAHHARDTLDDLTRATVLVVGAGEAGRLAASSLVDFGVGAVVVCNRTYEHAEALAKQLGGRAAPFAALDAELAVADVVLAATGAPEPLLSRDRVTAALAGDERGPMLIIDISVPRTAEPAVASIPGVTYRDIEDLQEVAAANARARAGEVERVQALVDEETARFVDWQARLQVVPTIAALTERAEQMRRAELAKTLRRLDASTQQREQLEAMTKALVRRILHDPIATLRERGDRDAYVDAAQRLFRLGEPGEPGEPGESPVSRRRQAA
jgi:glutamyl-tRNA reductase